MKIFDAIIIGGGVSGMAAGKKLFENGIDFLLLTKDIGGRMLTSQSHDVNYGASYITSDYENVIPYMGGGKVIKTSDCYFHNNDRPVSFFRWRTCFEIFKLIKLYFVASDYRRRLRRLRRKSLTQSQKKCLESDPVLQSYTMQPASEFVRENKLEYLNDTYFSPLFHSTGFIEYDKCNTFAYMDNLMALFCKTYVADHSRCCHLLPAGWEEKIIICDVMTLNREVSGVYYLETENDRYYAKNVVLALPYTNAKQLYDVPKPAHNNPIYVLEVSGLRNECCQNKRVIFFHPDYNDITILWAQENGNDVIFSKVREPPLHRYYMNHKIINNIYWETAVVLSGSDWSNQVLEEGVYLASDYNICGLEDAFISGVYAANQVIKKMSTEEKL